MLVEGPQETLQDVSPFLESNSEWIFTEWQKHRGTIRKSPWPERFQTGSKILYLGRYTPIRVTSVGDGLSLIEENGSFQINTPSSLTDEQRQSVIHEEFIGFFTEKIMELAATFTRGFESTEFKFKVMHRKGQWAHCKSDSTIALGWDLMFLPKPLIQYVVVHEIVHTQIRNHSEKFWGALSLKLPGWRERAENLKVFENSYL